MSNKRLYKSSVNCMLCGVCGGIAEYFDIDPTLVRLAWVILTCFGGAGIWAYIIAAIIIDVYKRQEERSQPLHHFYEEPEQKAGTAQSGSFSDHPDTGRCGER